MKGVQKMSNKVEKQTMTFCPDQYDGKVDKMYEDISKFLQIVLKNENICTIYQEDFGIVVINYEHDDYHSNNVYGCSQPIWLTADEQDYIDDYRSTKNNSYVIEGDN